MTDKLVDFLGEVDKNDDLKQQYKADPKGIAESFGLDPADVDILVSNNVEVMQARTGGYSGGTQQTDIFR